VLGLPWAAVELRVEASRVVTLRVLQAGPLPVPGQLQVRESPLSTALLRVFPKPKAPVAALQRAPYPVVAPST
jgi:hypothetical protein